MKKFICLLLAFLLSLQLAGCSVSDGRLSWNGWPWESSSELPRKDDTEKPLLPQEGQEEPQRVEVEVGALEGDLKQLPTGLAFEGGPYAYTQQQGGYECLETQEQQCYLQMEQAVFQISAQQDSRGYYPTNHITVQNAQLDEAQLRKVISAFTADHPNVFWLANTFGYAYTGQDTEVVLYSLLAPQECAEKQELLNQELQSIFVGEQAIAEGMSEFGRELYLHDWLLARVGYDEAAAQDSQDWQAFTAYGALVEGEAVCEGYARALQLLMSYAGISCRLATGVSQEDLHMWNVVQIDGQWYHLDPTWNDSANMPRYDYFNVTDEIISLDHTLDPNYSVKDASDTAQRYNLNIPACTATQANYFYQKAERINALDEETDRRIITALRTQAVSGAATISFLLGDGLDYEMTVSQLFLQSPYKFLYYVQRANEGLEPSQQIDGGSVLFAEVEAQRAVTVKITYQNAS